MPLIPPGDGHRSSSIPPQYGALVVLVVDDEPLLLKSTARMLEARGFEVLMASDLASAFAATRDAVRLDLLVTDISLHDDDGRALAIALREALPALQILFMSGLDAEAAGEGLPAGSWSFLPKPFTGRDLDARLVELLAGRTSRN